MTFIDFYDLCNTNYCYSDEVFDTNGPTCLSCAKRRCERKEIITEIIETEIKYGRDLRIILEEFYRPMLGKVSNVKTIVTIFNHFGTYLRQNSHFVLNLCL